jgi:hypothetical protein
MSSRIILTETAKWIQSLLSICLNSWMQFYYRGSTPVWRNGERNELCSKMETCTSVQQAIPHSLRIPSYIQSVVSIVNPFPLQNQPLIFLVIQNSGESFKSNFSFKLSTSTRLHGYAQYRDYDNSFLIEIKSAEKGTHILQVFLNNTEVPIIY